MPLRVMPTVGQRVQVVFLASRVAGVIERVWEDGRELSVRTEEGESLRFALNPATALFVSGSERGGPRLLFETA